MDSTVKRILAAVDFSDVSDAVVTVAASMARASSARLVLLHVAAPNPDFIGFEAGPQTVRDARARELRSEHGNLLMRVAELREGGIDAEAVLVEGPTTETILEKVEHFDADVIVMGSHGHGPIHRVLVGSVSEAILRRSPVPVLVVPARFAVREKT